MSSHYVIRVAGVDHATVPEEEALDRLDAVQDEFPHEAVHLSPTADPEPDLRIEDAVRRIASLHPEMDGGGMMSVDASESILAVQALAGYALDAGELLELAAWAIGTACDGRSVAAASLRCSLTTKNPDLYLLQQELRSCAGAVR